MWDFDTNETNHCGPTRKGTIRRSEMYIEMCGIAGKLSLDGQQPIDPDLIQKMTDVVAHRGPDDEGNM